MNNFKIESILPESTLEVKQIQLPPVPTINVNIATLSLLTYDLDVLLEAVSDYLKGQNNQQMLVSALKVLGSSLNDKKLSSNLQKIILEHEGRQKRIYGLLILWSHCCSNFISVMLKLPPKLRKQFIKIMVCFYFLQKTTCQGQVRKNMSQFISIVDQKQILQVLKNSYIDKKQPLLTLISKCQQIRTQNNELLSIIQNILKFAGEKSDSKVYNMLENLKQNEGQIQYLIKQIPNITVTLTKHFRKIINIYNIFQQSTSSQFGSMLRSATKEWLQEGNNYWQCVDKYYSSNSQHRLQVLAWGKQLGKQNVFSQSISIKYLYSYFQGNSFQFNVQDRLITSSKCHQGWIDTYRSIAQCSSYEYLNLIAINVTGSVKYWKAFDLFSYEIKHKGFRKFIDSYKDGYQKIKAQYLSKNKKLQLAYSSLIIKHDNEQKVITLKQLIQFLDNDVPFGNKNYRNEYQAFQEQVKIKQESRKDHNIVVEARLVRLLKRNKTSLTIDWLAKESKYDESIVALAMKRLCNKGIAQVDQKQNYTYVP